MSKGSLITFVLVAAVLGFSFFFERSENLIVRSRHEQHKEYASVSDLGEDPFKDASLSSHLPILVIETGGQKIPGAPVANALGHLDHYELSDDGSDQIKVKVSEISKKDSWHHDSDEADKSYDALFRIRGNSSRWFSKKSYRIRLIDETLQDIDAPFLDMKEGNQWALYGPFLDKTLIRNYMWMNIASRIMPGYTPEVRFCEVMIDGEYQGVYVLMEMIETGDGRVDLSEYEPGDLAMSYMVRIEPRVNPEKQVDNFSFYTYRMETGRNVEIIYPPLKYQDERVKRYVETDLSEVERKIFGAETADGSHAWKDEIDLDSFINYYIIEEFLGINDTFSASTYFYRDVRGKLCIGPVWDFNNALDNFFQPVPDDDFILAQRGWFAQMMKDKDFVERVIRRYKQLREGILSDENLLTYIKETEDYLGPAIERNFEVWGYSFDPDMVTSRERRSFMEGGLDGIHTLNPEDYAEANEMMIDYLLDHSHWLDENIDSLRQYCHPSKFSGQIIE